jgi:hypothetical protein
MRSRYSETRPIATSPATWRATPLPPLQQAELDADGLNDLLRDLELLTEIVQVRVKRSSTGKAVGGPLGLAEIRELLKRAEVSGVQLTYRYNGGDYIDTLVPSDHRWKLVRIQLARSQRSA